MSVSKKIGPSSASWGSFIFVGITLLGFPDGASGKEPTCQWRRCQRHGFDPSVVKISWKKAWQSASVLPENSHGQEEPGRLQSIGSQSQTRLSDWTEPGKHYLPILERRKLRFWMMQNLVQCPKSLKHRSQGLNPCSRDWSTSASLILTWFLPFWPISLPLCNCKYLPMESVFEPGREAVGRCIFVLRSQQALVYKN